MNLFFTWLKELNFFPVWLTELNLFLNTTHRIVPFLWIRLTEMDLFLGHDAKSWTPYFLNMTRRIELSFVVIQRIELFNIWFKELNFFNMSQRMKLFFECDLFLSYLNIIPTIEVFLKVWPKELNFFWKYVSKNWTIFLTWLEEHELFFFWWNSINWTLFLNTTRRIELIFWMTQRIELHCLTQRIEPFSDTTWVIEPFFDTTQRIEPFFLRLKELFFEKKTITQRNEHFFQYHSKN